MSRNVNGIAIPDEDVYAFPLHARIENGAGQGVYITTAGMTLRDWFAGQALVGMPANPQTQGDAHGLAAPLAVRAYAVADALMKAREEA